VAVLGRLELEQGDGPGLLGPVDEPQELEAAECRCDVDHPRDHEQELRSRRA
jgi:hypothetical protein